MRGQAKLACQKRLKTPPKDGRPTRRVLPADPKAARQQAAPGDQRGGPAAAHIGFQGNVENPQETGPGQTARAKTSRKRTEFARSSGRGAFTE